MVIASIVLIAVVIHDFKLRKKYPNFNHPEEQELDQDIHQFSYGTQFGDDHNFLNLYFFNLTNLMRFKISELEMKNFPALQERLIPRCQITLKNTELGAGHFGKVYKG